MFKGHKHPLSNFFECNIDIYGKHFASTEAAYQYRKALQYEEWQLADEIAQCERGVDAKRLGDTIYTDQDWWDIRQSVMMEVLQAKARQCPEFRNTLLASKGNSLVEDTVHDFWGKGKNGEGCNKLGTLLQALRSNLPPEQKPTRQVRSHSNPASYGRPTNFGRRDPGCGYCGEPGHSSDVCGHGRPVRCRHCQGFRHKEKSCWYKKYD